MNDPLLPVWVTAIATIVLGIATFMLALVAAFQDMIRERVMRPKLKVAMRMSPPDSLKARIVTRPSGYGPIESDCYYFRLRVANEGNRPATNVEVFASELHQLKDDGSWSKVNHFQPMNLKWSNIGQPQLPILHRGMEKLCDIGHIIDPSKRANFALDQPPAHLLPDPSLAGKTTLSLDVEVIPFTYSHILFPGTYRLVLKIGATEVEPVIQILEIWINGTWHDMEALFLGPCVNFSILENAA